METEFKSSNPVVVQPAVGTIQPANNPIPEKPKKKFHIPKIAILGVFLLLLLILMEGGLYLAKKSENPSPTPITKPSPTPDLVSALQTYTNTNREYSFSYPFDYVIKETKVGANTTENISLEKNVEQITGGGFGGGDTLGKGIIVSFTIWPKKDLSEATLRKEFGSNTQISQVTVGGKIITKITLEDSSVRYFYSYLPEVLEISSIIGSSSTEEEKINYLKDYEQILSTFQFIDPSISCTPRPSCLDSNPRCMIPETDDMCPPTSTSSSSSTPANPGATKPDAPANSMGMCTLEARICPDGVTSVGRSGPKCEFEKCPGE